MSYRTTIHPRPAGILLILEGRFTLFAIAAFVLLSATFALATAILPEQTASSEPLSPVVVAAETQLKDTLDQRVHLHLKRLASLQ